MHASSGYMCACARMNVRHRRNCGNAANTNYGSAVIDTKASTSDSKEKLTHCVCSWQMFSTAASKGLLGVQGSNTELDTSSHIFILIFLVYMWDLLYMYLIYKINIFLLLDTS